MFASLTLFAGANCNQTVNLTGTGPAPITLDNRLLACTQFSFTYTTSGFTAVMIAVQGAPDAGGTPGVYSTANISGANPLTALSGNAVPLTAPILANAAWVRINVVTVAGSGTISYSLVGPSVQIPVVKYSSVNRPPLPSDDSTLGYTTGATWQFNRSIWTAISVSPGAAVWSHVSNSTIMPGTAGGTPLAAYGAYQMISGYTGPLMVITRFSDSTTFSVPNPANWGDIDTFCKSTSCGVSTLYDQSGNGYNLTQSAFANMPQISGNMVNGYRTITFASRLTCSPNPSPSLGNTSLPATINNISGFMIGRMAASTGGTSGDGTLVEYGNPIAQFTVLSDAMGILIDNAPSGGNIRINAYYDSAQLSVYGFMSGSSVFSLTDNNNTYPAGDLNATVSTTGITLGNSVRATYAGNFDLIGFVTYTGASPNYTAFLQTAASQFNIVPQSIAVDMMAADSIGAGLEASSNLSFFVQSEISTNLRRGYNDGVGSQTGLSWQNFIESNLLMAGPITGLSSRATIELGTNDIAGGETLLQIENYIQTIATEFHAKGMAVIVNTVISRNFGSTPMETERQALNSWIQNNWHTFADAPSDVASNPLIGCPNCYSNTAYFASDGVHLTTLGHSIWASVYTTAKNTLDGISAISTITTRGLPPIIRSPSNCGTTNVVLTAVVGTIR